MRRRREETRGPESNCFQVRSQGAFQRWRRRRGERKQTGNYVDALYINFGNLTCAQGMFPPSPVAVLGSECRSKEKKREGLPD